MRVNYDKDQLASALANALKERDEAREALLIIANSKPKNIGSILAQGFFDYHNFKKHEIDERRKKEAKE